MSAIRSLSEIMNGIPELKSPVIHGLLRRGEVAQISARSKVGKSWLALQLAMSVAGMGAGASCLGFRSEPGRVLIADEFPGADTLADRIKTMAEAFSVSPESFKSVAENIDVIPARRDKLDFDQLRTLLCGIKKGKYALVLIPDIYLLLPVNFNENDSTQLDYFTQSLDRIAEGLDVGLVICQTQAKPNPNHQKSLESGASAMSRSFDTTVILRPHAEDDSMFMFDAKVRSWPNTAPFQVKFHGTHWSRAE